MELLDTPIAWSVHTDALRKHEDVDLPLGARPPVEPPLAPLDAAQPGRLRRRQRRALQRAAGEPIARLALSWRATSSLSGAG